MEDSSQPKEHGESGNEEFNTRVPSYESISSKCFLIT